MFSLDSPYSVVRRSPAVCCAHHLLNDRGNWLVNFCHFRWHFHWSFHCHHCSIDCNTNKKWRNLVRCSSKASFNKLIIKYLSDGVSALPSKSADRASFSISEIKLSSSSALIVGFGVSIFWFDDASWVILKPVSLPLLLVGLPLDAPLLSLPLAMLPLLLELPFPFAFFSAFLFRAFSAFVFLPPFSLLLPFLLAFVVSLLTGDVDKLGHASLFFSGPFCVPFSDVCLLFSPSLPFGELLAAAVCAMSESCRRFSYSWCLPWCISSFVKLASRSPNSCKYIQSGFGHCWFFMKWLQYFVVPKLVFISLPSIMMLLTLCIARSASLLMQYVTYADADGPCAPAYVVLGFITTLWIFPYLPKYSCFLRICEKWTKRREKYEFSILIAMWSVNEAWVRTSASASRGGNPTTNTKFFWTTRTFAKCLRFSEIFCFRCWSLWRFSAFSADIYPNKKKNWSYRTEHRLQQPRNPYLLLR